MSEDHENQHQGQNENRILHISLNSNHNNHNHTFNQTHNSNHTNLYNHFHSHNQTNLQNENDTKYLPNCFLTKKNEFLEIYSLPLYKFDIIHPNLTIPMNFKTIERGIMTINPRLSPILSKEFSNFFRKLTCKETVTIMVSGVRYLQS